MLVIAAAASLAIAPQNEPVVPTRATAQARAIVRIVSAVSLRLGVGPIRGEAPSVQDVTVHTDGSARPARLIEFQ